MINGSAKVAPETRELVLTTLAELDYHPNHAARSMRLARSFSVAYVAYKSSEFADPAMGLNLASMPERLKAAGYNLDIRTIADGASDELENLRRALLEGRIDGAVVAALPPGEALDRLARWDRPLVAFDQPDIPGLPTVWACYRDGIVQAVRHLAARGRRRIAFVGGPPETDSRVWNNTERYALAAGGMRGRRAHPAPGLASSTSSTSSTSSASPTRTVPGPLCRAFCPNSTWPPRVR